MPDITFPTSAPETGDRPGRLARTVSYYAAFVALGLVNASLGPTLPGLAENTNSLLREVSFLFAARSLGYLIGSLLGGRLYDRVSGHRVMMTMIIGMTAALALTPVVSQLGVLVVVLLLLGVTAGGVDVGGNTLLVWVHRREVGPFMNGLHFFFGVGAFLSPIIIAQALLRSGGVLWAYWSLALLVFPVAILLLRLPAPPARSVSQDDSPAPINYWLTALIACFFFLYVGAEVSFGGWIFTYTVTLGVAGEATAAYLTSAFWGALTVGRLLAIPIAARLRPRTILLSDLIGGVASLGLILGVSGSLPAVWLGTLGLGLAMASIFPTMLSFAERRMPITGQITGWFFVGASLGGMTLPWLIGQFFETVGPRIVMAAILLDLIVAVGIFTALMVASSRSHPEAD